MRTPSNVYILENEEQCYMSQIDESLLWHRRIGHLDFDNLVKISQKGVIRNLPKIIKPPIMFVDIVFMGKKREQASKSKNIQPLGH